MTSGCMSEKTLLQAVQLLHGPAVVSPLQRREAATVCASERRDSYVPPSITSACGMRLLLMSVSSSLFIGHAFSPESALRETVLGMTVNRKAVVNSAKARSQ